MKHKITKKELNDLYFKEYMTLQEISDKKNIPKTTLFRIFKKYGLQAKKYSVWNKGKSCLEDKRILSGEDHPRWKDASKYYIEYKLLKKIMVKNKVQCEHCFSPAKLLHHKDKNTKNNSESNLMPLCSSCHAILHNRERGITVYQNKCKWCGEKFVVLHNKNCKQIFCSLSCKSSFLYYSGQSSLTYSPKREDIKK